MYFFLANFHTVLVVNVASHLSGSDGYAAINTTGSVYAGISFESRDRPAAKR
jgi:hypothetical protein